MHASYSIHDPLTTIHSLNAQCKHLKQQLETMLLMLTAIWDWLLVSDAYSSRLVFFLYCLSVSQKLRRTGSWSRAETRQRPLGSLVSILTVNLGGRLLITAALRGDGCWPVLQQDDKIGIVLLCW